MNLARRKLLLGSATLIGLSACALPTVGPSRSAIKNAGAASEVSVVPVNQAIAQAMYPGGAPGFPSSFYGGGSGNYEAIAAGDMLQITIWEQSDNGVFATLGQRVTALPETRVNEKGTIFIPYVGEIQAVGKTTDQLRRDLTARLEEQTPEPQVEVRRLQGKKGSVMVFAEGGGGLVPLNEGNQKLTSMIAEAGGVAGDPQSLSISVTRGSSTGTIRLQDLYDSPKNNISLRANDRIVIEPDRRFYRIMGSGGRQGLFKFTRPEISVLDAIAENGGLNAMVSDPSGIFVFRNLNDMETQKINGISSRRVAFTFNLKEPSGMFLADEFFLRSEDTVYITEAPFVTWTKVISAISSTALSLESLSNVRTDLRN